MNIFIKTAELLSEPANETINHVIDRTGIGSIATVAAAKAAEQAETGLSLPDWAAIIAMVGGILYIVKLSLEIVIKLREVKTPPTD